MLTQWIPRNNTFVFAPSLVHRAHRQGSCSVYDGQRFCMCARRRREEKREEMQEAVPGNFQRFFPSFFFFFYLTSRRVERQVERRGTNRREELETFSGAQHLDVVEATRVSPTPSQGQTLLFMQPGPVQTPGMLQRQATSHAQRSLVITGRAAWPHHSHVNIHTGRHFAWEPVINDPDQRKRCFSMCDVNVSRVTQQTP